MTVEACVDCKADDHKTVRSASRRLHHFFLAAHQRPAMLKRALVLRIAIRLQIAQFRQILFHLGNHPVPHPLDDRSQPLPVRRD